MKRIFNIARKNLEAIGLFFLIVSFGWQCFEEHCNQTINEAHIITINEKLDAIWGAAYDEVLHSERYKGRRMNYLGYETLNDHTIKDWSTIKKELSGVEAQGNFGWICRVFLYILGSILIIVPKLNFSIK